jgi:hypothetical protein
VADPFVTPTTATKIKALAQRGFATAKLLGSNINLVLQRDLEQDGSVANVPVQNVLMVLARREPVPRGETGTLINTADGEFQKEEPFNVMPGDYFRLPVWNGAPPGMVGQPGVITAVLPAENGIVRALFTLRV